MENLIKIVNGIPTYNGKECHYDIGLTAGEMTSSAVREVMTRLAAYEDTGLEPEEIPTRIDMAQIAMILQTLRASGLTPDKLPRAAGLVKAQDDGRVVGLAVDANVFIVQDGRVYQFRVFDYSLIARNNGNTRFFAVCEECDEIGDLDFWANDIGKTVFLTRAEAEAALDDK
ncbi:hypothetical protein [Intestinibacillus massiliensis]